jgi:hypothetical protein
VLQVVGVDPSETGQEADQPDVDVAIQLDLVGGFAKTAIKNSVHGELTLVCPALE